MTAKLPVAGEVEDLRQSEQRFRLLVDSVKDYAIFMLDTRGRIASWNEGARRIKGYEADEIIGRHFSTFYPQEDIEADKPEMELKVAAATGRFEDEGWRLRKDGTRIWANVIITALRGKDGTLLGFAKVTRDMSERRRADEILRQSEERFRLLVDSVKDYAIFMLDTSGRIASWNEGARWIKGYEADEIIGRHFSAFYPQEDIEAGKPEMELKVAAATGRFEDEGWRLRKDGTRIWANVIISAVRNPSGQLIGFSKVTRDLTERRRHEEAQAEALEALAKSNQELDEYAGFVSHDLQEPLRKMASYAGVLVMTQPGLNAQGKAHLANIVDAAKRMRALIIDLLDYSRIGRVGPQMADVEIGETARAAIEDLSLSVKEAGATLAVGPLPRVRGNAVGLQRVFQNLLSNALKYRDPARAPEIRVDAERQGAGWVVSVRDNGIGFDPQFAKNILRPFQRLHAKAAYPGTGLGLAASKKIVELHGGRLWAESAPGKGSAFFFSLPDGGVKGRDF